MSDSITHEEMPMPKKIRLEIPVGAIESDSGSHILDILTIVTIMCLAYVGKKVIDRLFKRNTKETRDYE